MKRNLSELDPQQLVEQHILAFNEGLNPRMPGNGGSDEFPVEDVAAEMVRRMAAQPTIIIVKKTGLVLKTFLVMNPDLVQNTYMTAAREHIREAIYMFLDENGDVNTNMLNDYINPAGLEIDVIDHTDVMIVR